MFTSSNNITHTYCTNRIASKKTSCRVILFLVSTEFSTVYIQQRKSTYYAYHTADDLHSSLPNFDDSQARLRLKLHWNSSRVIQL